MCAQGVQYTRKEAGDGGTAVPYPLVTVCTSGAAYTPLPCTPKASIYSDAALTVPLANPFRGDMFGNIEFYATPAAYVVSVTAPYSPGYSFKMSASGGFAGAIASTQVAFGSALNTIAGSSNFTWDNTAKSLTVTNTGLSGIAPIYAIASGVTVNEAGLVAQCQQLGNFFCEAGQFVASDSGAGPIGSVIGIASVPSHTAAGTLATMTGVDITPSVGNGAGAITTSRGIHVGGVSFPTGTSPTTHDGIKIDDQCAGSFPATTCIGLNVAAQSNGALGIQAASLKVPNSGVFTNTQMNLYLQALINACSPLTEFQAVQGVVYSTDGLTGCVTGTAGAAAHQNNGVAGYATTQASANFAVGGYLQSRCLANNAQCWGTNSVVQDLAGLTTNVKLLNEYDIQPRNLAAAYSTVNGALYNLFAPALGDGVTFANAFGPLCAKGVAGGIWQVCFNTSDGASADFGLMGSKTTTATSNSQGLLANTRDGANVIRSHSLFADASGSWTFNSFNGKMIYDANAVQKGIVDYSANSSVRTYVEPDSSGTHSLAVVEYCGATTGATQACAKTVQALPLIIWGDVTLNTATSQSITTLPFTNALYSCSGSDLTTAAGIVSFNTYANASVTIVETGGVNTDHLRYVCVGN